MKKGSEQTFPRQITSIKDDRIVEARSLLSAAERRRMRKCLLEDAECIGWALDAGIIVERVFWHEKITAHPLLDRLQMQQVECFAVTEGILKKISDTRYLIPFIGIGRIDGVYKQRDPLSNFVVVLDDVRDHGNIGTIIRTARAFGIRDLLTTTADTDLWYRKIIEASRGKIFDIHLKQFDSAQETLNYLKQQGFQVIATSPYAPVLQAGVRLQPKPIALVVGNETVGVSDDLLKHADLVVQIPMSGQVESLNVGVATGISVYEFKLKLVLAMLTHYIRRTLGREMNVTSKMIQLVLDADLAKVTSFRSIQVILLMVLKCDEVMSFEQVSKDTATFGAECDTLLQPLFDQKLIQLDESSSTPAIRLTAQGEQFLGQLWGIVESSEEKIFQNFTEQERQQFITYLKRIQTNCEQVISDSALVQ